jgi:hypothetical protein
MDQIILLQDCGLAQGSHTLCAVSRGHASGGRVSEVRAKEEAAKAAFMVCF